MKRYGHLFEKIVSMDNLRKAAYWASHGKHKYQEIMDFQKDSDNLLLKLQQSLINHTFTTSQYIVFDRVEGHKLRHIYKLPFYPDRIVHWAILLVIEPIFIKSFIPYTFSAIPLRGQDSALREVLKGIRKYKYDYAVKIDIRKYYPSINHDILKQLLSRKFKDPELLNILYNLIDSLPPNEGIPIGNYLSQYFGNFYLSVIDNYAKHILKLKCYYRYMDDIVILGENPQYLRNIIHILKYVLSEHLRLIPKQDWHIVNIPKNGLDFVGVRIFTCDKIILRKRLKEGIFQSVNKVHKDLKSHRISTAHTYNSVQSYKGWLKKVKASHFYEKYVSKIQGFLDFTNLIRFHSETIRQIKISSNGTLLFPADKSVLKILPRVKAAYSYLMSYHSSLIQI